MTVYVPTIWGWVEHSAMRSRPLARGALVACPNLDVAALQRLATVSGGAKLAGWLFSLASCPGKGQRDRRRESLPRG